MNLSTLARWAWRDSRGSRSRLGLVVAAAALGIGLLTAAGLFRASLNAAMDRYARTLLGADVLVESREPFTTADVDRLRRGAQREATEVRFPSMVYVPANGRSRLCQIRALGAGYPFYGHLETAPAGGEALLGPHAAILEESLLLQLGLRVGDEVRIGRTTMRVAAALRRAPGEASANALIAPRVYLALAALPETGLVTAHSLAWYRRYLAFPTNRAAKAAARSLDPTVIARHWKIDTVDDRRREIGEAALRLQRFLNLVGVFLLLLGGAGVGAAVKVHLDGKREAAATLRCLGARSRDVLLLFSLEATTLGLVGAALGLLIGAAVAAALPAILSPFLPVEMPFVLAPGWMAGAFLAGGAVAAAFALIPLLPLRRVPPLEALRRVAPSAAGRRDPAALALSIFLVAGFVGFVIVQSDRVTIAAGVAGGAAAAIAALVGIAGALKRGALRVARRPGLGFWRHGIANLHRPGNQTTLIAASIGLATAVVVVIGGAQRAILGRLAFKDRAKEPTLAFFDVQPDERSDIESRLREAGATLVDQAPIVTMRLSSARGRSVEQLRVEKPRIPEWALNREYRSTFRSSLEDTETIVKGRWQGSFNGTGPVPISLEVDLADRLRLKLGDPVRFDVQGVPVDTVVASLRRVDWYRMRPNFFIVFPEGPLDGAPATWIETVRADTPAESARLQRDVVAAHPTVSAIDVSLVVSTIDAYIGRAAFAVRFLGLFAIAAALLLVSSAVLASRRQRSEEAVLLRTLGASRRALRSILIAEHAAVAAVGASAGTILGLLGAWALSRTAFEASYRPGPLESILLPFLIALLAAATALWAGRAVWSRAPLELLREDA